MISFKVYQQLFEIKEGLIRIECINLPLYNEFEDVYPLYKDVDETTFMEQMNHTYTIQEKAIMAIIGIKYPELIKNKDLNYISSICEFLANNNISPLYYEDYVRILCNNQVYNYAMLLYSSNYGITKHTILFDLLYELYDLYGGLLTDKQKKYFEDYYFLNLSLGEMAENYQVSRNAIFRQVHIVTKKLEEYEEILQLYQKKKKLEEVLTCNSLEEVKRQIESIIE